MTASPPPVSAALARGELVLGKYRVRGELGAGGMGRVVEAEHVELGRLVALKTLHPDLVARPGFAERFLREARIVAGLGSPHVARVLDVDRLADGTPVLVLERLVGRDLDAACAEQGPLPVAEAARLVIEACDALAEAHERGVVHRDVKPANLFLAEDPAHGAIVKVLDFGVAKLVDDGARTATGHAIGSPRYMAPEQVRRQRDVDARADVWALGVTLARLVGDRDPFDGDDALAIAASVLEQPADLSAVPSPELVAIVSRCLEKRPEARYADVVELARDLAPLAGPAGARALAELLRRRDARARTPGPAHVASTGEATETFDAPLAPARGDAPPPGGATAETSDTEGPPGAAPSSTASMGKGARVAAVALGVAAVAAVAIGLARPRSDVASAAPPVSRSAAPSAAAAPTVEVTPVDAPSGDVAQRPPSQRPRPAPTPAASPPQPVVDPPRAEPVAPVASPAAPSAKPPRDPLGDRK